MRSRSKINILLWAGATLWLFSWGCTSIPDGKAPTGPIVPPSTPRPVLSTAEAVNRFATSMSAGLLRNFAPGTVIVCRQDFLPAGSGFERLPLLVVGKSGDLFVFRFSNMPSVPTLYSRIEPGKRKGDYLWDMSLRYGDKPIWQESCTIRVKDETAGSKP